MQSAALLVVGPASSGRPWVDRRIDLRVEDHAEPLMELRRLLGLHRAYQHMNAGDLAMEHGDTEAARREYGLAESLNPGNPEMAFWHAVALANAGEVEASLPVFKRVFTADPDWAVLLPRLVPGGFLTVSQADLARIRAQAP
jgi:uncharacterized Ntn-hydrolase superfamily protein